MWMTFYWQTIYWRKYFDSSNVVSLVQIIILFLTWKSNALHRCLKILCFGLNFRKNPCFWRLLSENPIKLRVFFVCCLWCLLGICETQHLNIVYCETCLFILCLYFQHHYLFHWIFVWKSWFLECCYVWCNLLFFGSWVSRDLFVFIVKE